MKDRCSFDSCSKPTDYRSNNESCCRQQRGARRHWPCLVQCSLACSVPWRKTKRRLRQKPVPNGEAEEHESSVSPRMMTHMQSGTIRPGLAWHGSSAGIAWTDNTLAKAAVGGECKPPRSAVANHIIGGFVTGDANSGSLPALQLFVFHKTPLPPCEADLTKQQYLCIAANDVAGTTPTTISWECLKQVEIRQRSRS